MPDRSKFLPVTMADAKARSWNTLDFVYIIGDAYVDHPSFGAAIISRVIEALGFSIGIISQPVKPEDYQIFGKPKYAFLQTLTDLPHFLNINLQYSPLILLHILPINGNFLSGKYWIIK